MKFTYRAAVFAVLFFTMSQVYPESNPRVESFSPQGLVKKVRQVTVRFSEQMVPFGDPRALESPFEIECSEKGTGRWADGKNWVYDFDRILPAGVQCSFRLKPGIKTLAGKKIQGQREFSFSTGGPSIVRSSPYKGSSYIAENQVFILSLDAEPDMASIKKHVYFSIEGIQDHVGIKIIEGKERSEILKSQYWYQRKDQKKLVLIQCKQTFPSEAMVSLVWGREVTSKSGVANVQDQVVRFKTRKPFSVNFTCNRENANADCIPILPMALEFSAPVSREQAEKIVLKSSSGKKWKPRLGGDNENDIYRVDFAGPFPPNSTFKIEIPGGIKDDAGRSLVNEDMFPLTVRTDKYPPLAKFAARFGILELKADPVLPVTLRNLEPEVKARVLKVGKDKGLFNRVVGKFLNVSTDESAIQDWLRRVGSAKRENSLLNAEDRAKDFTIPKKEGAEAFEVVGIPLKDPGLYVVELESDILGASLLGKPAPMYVPTAVLVTNLSVHFKWGRESSLVWVTALDSGEPVRNAEVKIKDCNDQVLWQGTTDIQGMAKIKEQLPLPRNLPSCQYNSIGRGLFVTAKVGEDISFVFSSWDDGIEPWRFQLPTDYYQDPAIAKTVFDRTLFRAGETVHMKHIIREHSSKGFVFPSADQLPDYITIVHGGSDEKYEVPLAWNGNRTALSEFVIPKNAKLGWYELYFQNKSKKKSYSYYYGIPGGGFRVEEFRVPLLKAMIKPPAEPLVNVKDFPLDINVQYLAGGGAGSLPVKLRTQVYSRYVPPYTGYDDFVFLTGPVKEGITRNGRYADEDSEADQSGGRGKIPSQDIILDKTGGTRVEISDLPRLEGPREVLTEIEFKDPNGELQTVSSRVPLWSSQYVIGIKPDSWAFSKENFKFHTVVLDITGKPVANAAVKIQLYTRKNYTHRKRLVGGFYGYEYISEVKKIKSLCEGKTDARGLLICQSDSPVSGNVILQAETRDKDGNRAVTRQDVWIAGKGDWWFEVSDNDRIDLLPEKKRYEPGETAVFQLRVPYRNATALITVEREGVIESWVKKISGKEPVITVPVKGSYAPNCFVSALVVRGRVSGVQPTAMVDMGRPSYKLGIAEIKVGWRAHELKVSVSSNKKVYNVRDRSKVGIKVRTWNGQLPPAGTEVAVAAVDEGLLELMPNKSWDLLSAMMAQRSYEVKTSTAQMQVVGRRHFGLKALPQGGGGGRQSTRELFDTLLLWKGRVLLNKKGEAVVTIPLNDSITSFRIVAVANGGTGLFGRGETSIQATRDLMIFAGLPPLVREGDFFKAEFTLRNTTKGIMDIEAAVDAEGIKERFKPVSMKLQPGEAKEIGWETQVPFGIEKLVWKVTARDNIKKKSDAIKVSQKVVAAVPVRTFQATIARVDDSYRVAVEAPSDALPGRGGVRMGLMPRISGGQGGITEYMSTYPYSCMEQRVSIAVSLRDRSRWDRAMSDMGSYMDSDGLVKYFPTCQWGSPVLTSYILAIGKETAWDIPQGLLTRMMKALSNFVEGKINRYSPMKAADLSIKKLTAIEALSRYGNARAKLLGSISIEPNLWPTSSVVDWFNILHNVNDIPDRTARIREAEHILRSRLNFQGTRMGFSTESGDYLWWLMVSNDVNSVRLILSLLNSNKWDEDMPRLVLGALSRQHKGRWDLTVANAWGVLALEKFSQKFESVPVSGTTESSLNRQVQTVTWSTAAEGKELDFSWPEGKETLNVVHKGRGTPWVTVQSRAAIPLKKPFSSGYTITKSIIPVEQKTSDRWSVGDVYRIRLEIKAQADQTWVVVNDPVPAGVTILGQGLARDSRILSKGEKREGWVWPAFEERSFEAFRAYYEYVPRGTWTVEYTIRINQSGTFQLPATRVEALYFPEMFGEIPNKAIEVGK